MNDKPILSVGLPVYNGEQFLEASLDSILAQTFADFELIISDNGSTDRTEEICRTYAESDPRIRYVRQTENLGASRNFNYVFEVASGDIFRWASHDDLCEPQLFERCVQALLDAPPTVVMTYPQTLLLADDGTCERYDDKLDLREEYPHQRLRHLVRDLVLCNAVFGFVRSDALRKTHLLGPFASSDEVLLAELSLLGPFREVPEPLFIRRMHQGRSTQANPETEALTAWWDPTVKKKRHLRRSKVLRENLRAVWSLPLPRSDRLRSTAALLAGYVPRWWKVMAGEVRRSVLPR